MKNLIEIGNMVEVSGVCEDHGDFAAQVFQHMKNEPPQCPECTRLETAERARVEQQARESKHADTAKQARLRAIDAPARLMAKRYADYVPVNATAAEFKTECQRFATNWPSSFEKGSNLILCGKPGTGKTHLATSVCKQIVHEHKHQPLYVTASKMLRYIRGAYSKTASYTESEAIAKFATVDLLVLDEVGVKLPSEHDKATLFEIIDERYQNELPTIVISNLTVDEIGEQTDARIVDRLKENGVLMDFTWESYRGSVTND